ncbi:MAG: hypothetical protein AAF743_10250, partial [Planctomycetota bacterium]
TVQHAADTTDPSVNLFSGGREGPFNPAVGQTISFIVNAADAGGISSVGLVLDELVGGTPSGSPITVPLTQAQSNLWRGDYTFVTADDGKTFRATATATDAAGNVGFDIESVLPFDPNNAPPAVSIGSPAAGGFIESAEQVVGSISDPESDPLAWEVVLTDATGAETLLGQGSGAVTSQPLVDVDGRPILVHPQVVADGIYTLTLRATDSGDLASGARQSSASLPVTIRSEYAKVGNFAVNFTDLDVQLGSLPISLGRTYDSFDASRSLAFGHGWDLGVDYGQLSVFTAGVSAATSLGLPDYDQAPYFPGTRIEIELPDGEVKGFTAQAIGAATPGQVNIVFEADDGQTDALLELIPEGVDGSDPNDVPRADVANFLNIFDIDGIKNFLGVSTTFLQTSRSGEDVVGSASLQYSAATGTFNEPGGFPFNPATYGGGGKKLDFRLQLLDGSAYIYDSATGQLLSIEDRVDNKASFATSGNQMSVADRTGQTLAEVDLERDGNDRVQTATYRTRDLVSGLMQDVASVDYTYTANGNLDTFTDRNGSVFQFGYDEQFDDQGVLQPGTLGRPHFLTSIEDVERAVTTLKVLFWGDEAPTPTQRGMLKGIVDASGNAADFGYTLRASEVDSSLPASATIEVVSDADGNTTEVMRDARGNVLRQVQQLGTAQYLVTAYTYNADGNQTTASRPFTVNAADASRFTTPVPIGHLASSTDYDDTDWPDLPTRVTDAAGIVTEYVYTAQGNVDIIRTFDAQGSPLETNNDYDASTGLLLKTTDAVNGVTEYEYGDTRGNLTKLIRLDENDNPVVLGEYEYNGLNQLIESTDASGHK